MSDPNWDHIDSSQYFEQWFKSKKVDKSLLPSTIVELQINLTPQIYHKIPTHSIYLWRHSLVFDKYRLFHKLTYLFVFHA